MNYLSPLILFFIIWLSQFVTSFEKAVSYEQHAQLQQELGSFIETYVKQQIPTVTEFNILSIYTKPPKKNKIRAYFNYEFKDSTTNTVTELEGFATLEKIKDQPRQEWSLDAIEISGERVNFDEPIVITPSEAAAKPEITAPTPEKTEQK